ncbi:MAG: GNAT family acetyltransferase [Proteobacteria bacterium]|nr:GNAT family acetyltransferase [Pseudomonadota bacterium]
MSVVIEPCSKDDLAGIDALWREAFAGDEPRHRAKAAVPAKLAFQPDLFLVAREDGRVIGSIVAGYDGYRGHINRVAVLESHRRKGVGALLVRAAEARLSALGCTKINLQIRAANHAVASFYRGLGYAVEDRISMGKLVVPP